jgi:predicted amidohydrolase YtcJ
MRTTAMPLATDTSFLAGPGVRTGFGDDRLRLGGIKVYYDGTGSFGTALMRGPWPDSDSRGTRVIDRERFVDIARACAAEGWSLGVHAVGGGAIDEVLAAFAEADGVRPIRPLRFTLIHAYLWPSPDNVELARRLGVIVAVQPALHYTVARRLTEVFGDDAIARATPVRAGWTAARSSRAAPTAPTSRSRRHSACGRPARAACAIAPDELRDLAVLQTAVGGEVVHEA